MAEIEKRRSEPVVRRWRSPVTRFFEDFLADLESEFPDFSDWWGRTRFSPALDVVEDDKQVVVTAELPGVQKDDMEITVHNGVLTLRGEKKEEKTSEEGGYHRMERRYGKFEKSVRLPDYVDEDKIKATYRDGVLTLTMPKSEAAKPKSIEIKEG